MLYYFCNAVNILHCVGCCICFLCAKIGSQCFARSTRFICSDYDGFFSSVNTDVIYVSFVELYYTSVCVFIMSKPSLNDKIVRNNFTTLFRLRCARLVLAVCWFFFACDISIMLSSH